MPYRYATESLDYTDYASGAVFYNAPGHPAFPVRLTSEIFQRCQAYWHAGSASHPTLYDPCCGAAYHLTTLGYVHGHSIGRIIASDVDADILAIAERNLSLLSCAGLDRRIAEIERMLAAYGKASHAAALESAKRLRQRLLAWTQDHTLTTHLFQADATRVTEIHDRLAGTQVDIVISDIPYGRRAAWRRTDPDEAPPMHPVWQLLEVLRPVLAPGAVVAIASDKGQKVAHESYRRIDRFSIGKRRITLMRPELM